LSPSTVVERILFGIFITSLSLIITLTMCYGVYPCSHLERHICHEVWGLAVYCGATLSVSLGRKWKSFVRDDGGEHPPFLSSEWQFLGWTAFEYQKREKGIKP
jgi:hypothetical protein